MQSGNAIILFVVYVCPKYLTDETPEPYREWLLTITDSLDEEVDETQYHKTEIIRIFDFNNNA